MLKPCFFAAMAALALPRSVSAQEAAPAPVAISSAATAPLASPTAEPAAPASPAPWSETQPVRFTLPNGLRVVLQPDASRPRVAVSIVYHVGSRDDPQGFHGLAHLTEHVMFTAVGAGASAAGNAVDYHELLERAGCTNMNGMTSPDSTVYFEELPSSQLSLGLWLEAQRMAYLLERADPNVVATARAAVLHEFDDRNSDGCDMQCLLHFEHAALYPEGHPYRDFFESDEDIAAMELKHVQWFFQEWYGPANATLAVVGDFSTEQATQQIQALFAGIRASHQVKRAPVAEVQLAGEQQLSVRYRRASPVCTYLWPLPSKLSLPEQRALDVLALSLERTLDRASNDIDDLLFADVAYQQFELGGEFLVSWHMEKKADLEAIRSKIDKLVSGARNEPMAADALDRSLDRFAGRSLFQRENFVTRARLLAEQDDLNTFSELARQYREITAAQVLEVARRYLPLDRRVAMCAEQSTSAPPSGRLRKSKLVTAKENGK